MFGACGGAVCKVHVQNLLILTSHVPISSSYSRGWVHTEEADHSSLVIKRINCELTRLLRQQTSTQPGPTTSHETALGRTARASALVGRFAWSKTQEEDELVEVPNEDSEGVAAVLVVIRRDCGLLVLNRLIHNSVSLRKAPEGIGYR